MDGQRPMDFGLVLPSYRDGASLEGIEASVDAASRLGFGSVFTTDHVLVDRSPLSTDYGQLFEALLTLAYAAGREPQVRVGVAVLVVPMRNAVVLAKELATLDALSRGRLILGVGVGWSEAEFSNLGLAARFRERGAYLDEAIALWRHLWSGSSEPFDGRFHRFSDAAFGPLPAQGANVPIWVGGRSEAALRRAGRVADGYMSSGSGPQDIVRRLPVIREAAERAGRELPRISARVRVSFGAPGGGGYWLSGTADEMQAEIGAFAAAGVTHLAVDFVDTDPERHVRLVERFRAEVAAAAT